MEPIFFESPLAFRRWLKRHHRTAAELWVGFHKKHTGRPTLTWPESVDEALCVGWIDGVRKRVDDGRYMIRFTPRRRGSIWSSVNRRRAEVLIAEGRMQPAGLAAWQAREAPGGARYSFEQPHEPRFAPADEAAFRKHRKAWAFFTAQPPGLKKTLTWWVISAKREDTRARRLATLIEGAAAGRQMGRLPPTPRRDPGTSRAT